MPLTQAQKDAASAASQNTEQALAAWPDDTPEKLALASQASTLTAGITAAVVPPPQPVQAPDPMLLFDQPMGPYHIGGATCDFLYIPYIRWARGKAGDWYGKDGPNGKVPYGQSGTIALGATGLQTIPLSGLPPDLTQFRIGVRSTGNSAPTARINSRSTMVGPQLTYLDPVSGQQVSVLALADVEVNGSTQAEIGGNQTISVRPGVSAFIRFPPLPPGTTAAVLTLTLVQMVDSGGVLEVYDGTWRQGPPPTDTMTLKGDSRVFFETESFEDADDYIKKQLFGDPAHGIALDTLHQRNIVVDETGHKVLQITFNPKVNSACTCSILFPNQDEADEAAVEFDLRFMPDMEAGMGQGFKCALGFSSATKSDDAYFASIHKLKVGRCGTLLAGNGGAKSHGNDGWSHRFDAFAPVIPPSHPLYQHVPLMQYTYWPGQSDYYGDPWPWNLAQFSPKLGEWHTITERCRVNSINSDGSFNKDAFFYGYLDHKLALKQEGFYQRTTDNPLIAQPTSVYPWAGVDSKLRIGRVWFNTYHGGTTLPLALCNLQVRNVRVARFA